MPASDADAFEAAAAREVYGPACEALAAAGGSERAQAAAVEVGTLGLASPSWAFRCTQP